MPSAENDAHGPDCMCPWCASERTAYCALSGSVDHPDHHLPTCPSSVIPPGSGGNADA